LRQLEQAHPTAPTIVVFCDSARDHTSKTVAEFLATSRIQRVPLPPYSSNLNSIERFRKFFERQALYDRYCESFGEFRDACTKFFADLDAFAPQ
jgi:transposase